MDRTFTAAGALALGVILLFTAAIAYADNDNGKGKGPSEDRGQGNAFGVAASTFEGLQEQIKQLQERLRELQKQRLEAIQDFRASTSSTGSDDSDDDDDDSDDDSDSSGPGNSVSQFARAQLKFLRSLSRGMSGDDVRDLQELLAEDNDVYPEGLVTGFFGPLTERAIRRFQEKHGIDTVGIFGPQTRARILTLFEGRVLPPGIAKRLGLDTSTTTPGVGVVTVCHKPVGTSPQTLVIGIPALGAHLAHGDSLGMCSGETATTTPPVVDTAPVISGITISGIASTSAAVAWTTNEAATGKIYYGTTTPMDFLSALMMSDASLSTAHSFTLSSLMASTTHYYVLESKDAAGNTATTSTQSFVTTD